MQRECPRLDSLQIRAIRVTPSRPTAIRVPRALQADCSRASSQLTRSRNPRNEARSAVVGAYGEGRTHEVNFPRLPTSRSGLVRLSCVVSIIGCGLIISATSSAAAQGGAAQAGADTTYDPVQVLVNRLDLERYKNTIKGLAQFGDRRQGTKRNRDAVDWIEAQLKQYGCQNVERITYQYNPPPPTQRTGRGRGPVTSPNGHGYAGNGPGGSRIFSDMREHGVNTDSLAQPDPKIRAIDAEPSTPGERQEVICMKVGTKYPNEMYIIGGHMDGIGWGQAVNDDASGSAIVMELARIF